MPRPGLIALMGRAPETGGGWTPGDLPNLAAWYDADDADSFTYSSGVFVSQWDDLSGNGRHITQGTAAKQPARSGSQNGRATVAFDGSDDALSYTTSVTWGTSYTIAAVLTPSTNTDDYALAIGQPNPHSAIITKYSSKAFETYNYFGSPYRATLGAAGATGWHTLIVVRAGTSITSLVDGSSSGSVTANTTSVAGGIYLGSSVLGDFGAINAAEVVVTTAALTGTDLTSLSDYLRTKWGTP